MPLQHRHGYAAGLHHGLPAGDITQPRSSPPTGYTGRRVRTADHPRSVRFEVAGLLRGVQPVVPHVHLPVSLAGPEPSDGAGPSRRCQGCFPPSPPSRGSGCPQLSTACCDRPPAVSFHHRRVQERLVALEVDHPEPVRRGRGELAVDQVRRAARGRVGDRGPPGPGHEPRRAARPAASAAPPCTGAPGGRPGAAAATSCGTRPRHDPWPGGRAPPAAPRSVRRRGRTAARAPASWPRSRYSGRSSPRAR